MAVERNFYIDIDRGPERPRTRPVGVPGASPLWPSLAPTPPRDPRDMGVAPLGAVPVQPSQGRALDEEADVPTLRTTRRPDAELAASLATLASRPSITRPITLADALAAMPPVAPGQTEPPTTSFGELAPEDEPTLPSFSGPSLAAAAPHSVSMTLERCPAPKSIAYLQASAAEAIPILPTLPTEEAMTDEYLTRSYDFRRPEAAELYERAVVPLWSAHFGRMLLSVFQGCPRQPGWQVVDVACGTGYPTLELAQLLGQDGDVAGVDLWGAGIERARARAAALRLNNAAFLVADVAACDLPEQAFDLAACNLGLTNFAHPDLALKGIARLLQPNGTLLLTTNLYGTMQEFFETYRSVLNDLGLLDLSWDVEGLMHMQPTVERVEGLLDIAGFTVDQTLSDHFTLQFPDGSTFLRSPMVGLSFLHSWRTLVADHSLRRVVFNEIERRLNARAAAWGHLDLLVPMLCLTARRRTPE